MKKLAGVLLAGFLALAVSALSGGVSPFAGGAGSPADPYQITNCYELQAMADNLGASYVLVNDIDASATAGWNAGAGFVPVGTQAFPFTGTFDGQNHKISGLFINRPGENYVGMFGLCFPAEIRNVGMIDVDIFGNALVGGLAGQIGYGLMENVYTTGSVHGGYYSVGGVVGWLYYATIRASYSEVSVVGNDYVGGLVGNYYGAAGHDAITNCYALGSVVGWSCPGGLVGNNQCGSGVVENCFSAGSVTLSGPGQEFTIGGLIGYLTGADGGNTFNSYWDVETSGQIVSAGGTGRTTAEMKQASTFPGWDFAGLWKIQEGRSYPYFRWQIPPVPENEAPVAVAQDIRKPAGVNCQAAAAAQDFDNGSYDPDGDSLAFSVSPAGPYPMGETVVTLTVTDPQGASSVCSAKITVFDGTPPSILSLTASPDSLWPANHKMVPVSIHVSASDGCSAPLTSRIVNVTSNEPVNGLGDGDTAPDWAVTDLLTLNLRAERSGTGSGRIYTITIECVDAAGNKTTGNATVRVPLSRGK